MKTLDPKTVTIVAGLGLIVPCAVSILGDSPSLPHPGSFLLVLPLFLGVPLVAVLFIGPLVFWLWMPKLFRGSERVPVRSLCALALVAVLSFWDLAAGWEFGLKYQGHAFVHGALWINVFCTLALFVILLRGRRAPSFKMNVVGHWCPMAWLVTYAFPYLGEMP